MNIENRVKEIATEIADYKFDSHYASTDYEWLVQRCKTLAGLFKHENAQQELAAKLLKIVNELEEENISLTHELVRERTLVFHQETVVYNLIKQGYLKMASF